MAAPETDWTMSVHPIDFQINKDLFSTPEFRNLFDEKATFQRWLDFEAALATVQGRMGIIPCEAAEKISTNARIDCIDLDVVSEGYTRSRNSVIPLLAGLRQACGDAGEFVHYGATTQDVIDTGELTGLREAVSLIYRDLRIIEKILIVMATEHVATPMVGRTHGQQALPITFGLKVSVWAGENRRNIERLKHIHEQLRYGQLGGAVGTMAALGPHGFEVARGTMRLLGLDHDPAAWHTSRDSIAEAVSVFTIIAMTLAKVANEIFQLQKTETGELSEPPPGSAPASSTMPHKQNPVICQRVIAISRHIRGLMGTVMEGMAHEHERDPRSLWAEWLAVPQLCIYTGAAVNYMKDVLSGLTVRTERMLKNLYEHRDMVMTEWLMFRLAESMGKANAQEKTRELLKTAGRRGTGLREVLTSDEETGHLFSTVDLEMLDRPEKYTGHAEEIVNRVVNRIVKARQNDPPYLGKSVPEV